MSNNLRQPIKYQTEPEYPTLAEVKAYAEDFRTGGADARLKFEKWAKYWLSSYLDILVTQLQESIYTVVAYPPAGFEVALVGDIEKLEYFRGWILQYYPPTQSWFFLAASQEVGIDKFIRLRREFKEE
jgi:hypothetical protein